MDSVTLSSHEAFARRDLASENQMQSKKSSQTTTNDPQVDKGPPAKQPQHRHNQGALSQLPFDLDSIDMASLEKIFKSPLPVGLKFPKDLGLEQLQKIIHDFHKNETRTDILTPLPLEFEPQKSIFSFLYTLSTFRDPTVRSQFMMHFFLSSIKRGKDYGRNLNARLLFHAD